MGEAFIVQRFSSKEASFAAIIVNCPEGSTCTCTNGTTSITLFSLSSQVVFHIPFAGTWTVTATDGTNSKSNTVSITDEGQFATINLYYSYYIIKNGESLRNYSTLDYEYYTSKDSNGNQYIDVNYDGDFWIGTGYYYCYIEDITEFNTLYVDGVSDYYNNGDGPGQFGVGKSSGISYTASASIGDSRGIYSLDVSNYSGEIFIIISGSGYNTDTQGWQGTSACVYNMWLQ